MRKYITVRIQCKQCNTELFKGNASLLNVTAFWNSIKGSACEFNGHFKFSTYTASMFGDSMYISFSENG